MSILRGEPAAGRSRRVACAVASLCSSLVATAKAEDVRPDTTPPTVPYRFRLPVEIGQGAAFDGARPGAEYVFAASALPGASYGPLELNTVLSVPYRNPDWDFAIGGRASLVVLPLLTGTVRISLAGEATYLTVADDARFAGGALLDLGGVVRIGGWGGYDVAAGTPFFLATLGVEVTSLGDPIGAIVESSPMEDDPNVGD